MTNQNNEYISSLQLDDFQILLKEFDIELDQSTQQRLLNMIKTINMPYNMNNIILF